MVANRLVARSSAVALTASSVRSPGTNRLTTLRLTGAFSIVCRTVPLLESWSRLLRSRSLASTGVLPTGCRGSRGRRQG